MATDIIARGLAVSNSGGGGGSTSVDIQDGVGIEFTGSDPIIINNGGITNVQTGNDSDDNGTIRVTYGKDSKTKSVPVKGLDNAAYKNVDTVINESTKDSENLPTTKAVKKVLDSKIDSSKLGEANGIATLDEYKKLVSDQLPSHNHGSNEVDAMTNYQKPSILAEKEIKETDSLNAAIGKLEKNLDDKMDDGNYAGSSTKGGSATSAEKLSNTEQIGTNKKPVYFSADGIPVAIDHTINSDVPENAKFTDTKYSAGTGIRVADDTMYNMGVLSVNESATNGCVDFTIGKNGTETSESKTIPVHGLGDAAYKSVDTVVTKDSAKLITSGAVSTELDKKINSSMRNSANGVAGLDSNSKINVSQIPTTDEYNVESAYPVTGKAIEAAINTLPNPMLYKGSLGEGGTITELPTASASNEGFTYKVITSGTYAGQSAKVGDVFISNGTEWTIIPSGDEPEGTVISVGMSVPTGLKIKEGTSPVTTSGTIEVQLDEGYVIPKEADIDELMNAVDNWFDVSQCIGLDNTYVTSTIGTDGYITVNTKSGVSTNTECYETTQLIDISKFPSGRFSLWIDFASGSISGSWLGFRVRKYDANKDYVISSYVKQETKVNGFYKIDTLSVDELINEGTYYIAITIWRSASNVYTDAKFKVYVTDDEIYPSHQEYCLSKISLREDINKKAGGIEESQNNYIEMKSGQRVYADTEEPYGNIEVGSIGVGFDSGLREFGVGAKKSATTFPVTFGTDGTPVTNYTIYGNSGGVGDRSTNYVDRMNLDAVGLYPNQTTGTVEAATGSNYSIIIPVSSLTDCFFSINRETTTWNRCRLAGYATYPEVGTTATFVDNITGTATDDTSGNYYYNSCADIPSGTNYIMVFLASAISSISSVDLFREAVKASKPMLTSGIEKLPYVKYYSIPITCNSVTSEISLDAPLATGESVAYEDSGSPIYTVNGQNTMAFGSTVAPAKIEFEYVGWHPTGEIADLIARVEALEAQL